MQVIWYSFDRFLSNRTMHSCMLNLFILFLLAISIYNITKQLLFIGKSENSEVLRRFQLIFRVILFNLDNESDAKVCLS